MVKHGEEKKNTHPWTRTTVFRRWQISRVRILPLGNAGPDALPTVLGGLGWKVPVGRQPINPRPAAGGLPRKASGGKMPRKDGLGGGGAFPTRNSVLVMTHINTTTPPLLAGQQLLDDEVLRRSRRPPCSLAAQQLKRAWVSIKSFMPGTLLSQVVYERML